MNIDEMLPKVKETELEILIAVDKFCKENNLRYSLAYGTLLGAVRHQGFIPWDDDIDIWMPREDYDRFNELWLKNPVEGYIIQNSYLEPEFPQNFTKIRKDNTAFIQTEKEKKAGYHKGIFIDIFPLDRVADNSFGCRMQKILATFMMLYTRKFAPPEDHGIKKAIGKVALGIVPKSKYDTLKKLLDKSIIRKSSETGNYKYFGTMLSLTKEAFSKDMFEKLDEVSFEGLTFSATSLWDEVLRKFYGDYMKFPPESERVWAHHPLFIDFEHNYENSALREQELAEH